MEVAAAGGDPVRVGLEPVGFDVRVTRVQRGQRPKGRAVPGDNRVDGLGHVDFIVVDSGAGDGARGYPDVPLGAGRARQAVIDGNVVDECSPGRGARHIDAVVTGLDVGVVPVAVDDIIDHDVQVRALHELDAGIVIVVADVVGNDVGGAAHVDARGEAVVRAGRVGIAGGVEADVVVVHGVTVRAGSQVDAGGGVVVKNVVLYE